MCAWVLAGMGLDAWAHTNIPQLETFLTPWHGVLYSGFTATIAWLLWKVRGALSPRPGLASVPVGYGLGLAGAAILVASGVGDAIWHTVFGIEVGVEAALSPTHIGLFLGTLLIVTTPLRAAWSSSATGRAPTLRAFLPALLSLTFATVLVSVFFSWLSAFREWSPVLRFDQPEGLGVAWLRSYVLEHGIASVLVTNLLLLAPLLLVLRRWRPPLASFTLLFTAAALTVCAIDQFRLGEVVLAALAGGLAADCLVARAGRWADPTQAHRVVATVTPLALWGAYFLVFQVRRGIAWPAELWTGSIVLAALSGLALSMLMIPPGNPVLGRGGDPHSSADPT
jgi:hypothetical protein